MTALVIAGLAQSLVPSLLRTALSTLTVVHRHASPGPNEGTGGFLISQETSVVSRQESEADAEATDTCEILEGLGWPEGIAERRSTSVGEAASRSEALPRDDGRAASLLRRSWALSVLTPDPGSLPAKLCRFLC
jgi:hypothetical protein